MTTQFIKFIIAGGIAALLNFFSRIYYSRFVDFSTAVLIAYLTGMITAFFLSKFFVFEKSRHTTIKEFSYFTLVNVVAIIQTWVVSVGLAEYVFPYLNFQYHREELAHIAGITVPVFSSYYGHKLLSFRSIDVRSLHETDELG